MKADDKVMQHLTGAVAMELTAINQYMLHAQLLDHWGFRKLSAKMREEMAEEQGHAERLMQRILFLDGVPDTGKLNKVDTAKSVKSMFEKDLKDERDAVRAYKAAARDAETQSDYVTRDLFISLITDEEGHIDWISEQLGLMERLGEAAYLQLQI